MSRVSGSTWSAEIHAFESGWIDGHPSMGIINQTDSKNPRLEFARTSLLPTTPKSKRTSSSSHGSINVLIIVVFVSLFHVSRVSSLKINPKPCSNALGEEGTCMFVWECIKTEGKHLGTCVDGFLFGSCCGHNDTSNDIDEAINSIHADKPVPASSSDVTSPASSSSWFGPSSSSSSSPSSSFQTNPWQSYPPSSHVSSSSSFSSPHSGSWPTQRPTSSPVSVNFPNRVSTTSPPYQQQHQQPSTFRPTPSNVPPTNIPPSTTTPPNPSYSTPTSPPPSPPQHSPPPATNGPESGPIKPWSPVSSPIQGPIQVNGKFDLWKIFENRRRKKLKNLWLKMFPKLSAPVSQQKPPPPGPSLGVTPATIGTTLHTFRPPIFSIFGTHRPPPGTMFFKPPRPTRPTFIRPPINPVRPTTSIFQPFNPRPSPAPFPQFPLSSNQHPTAPAVAMTSTAISTTIPSTTTVATSTTTSEPTTTVAPFSRPTPFRPHYPQITNHPLSSTTTSQLASGSNSIVTRKPPSHHSGKCK